VLYKLQYDGDEAVDLPGGIRLTPGLLVFSEPVYQQLQKDDLFLHLLEAKVITLVEPKPVKENTKEAK
jgi:hypothetical protein